MACGKPVIAFGKGGVLETVQDGISGVFFPEQSVEALEEALTRAGSMYFDPQKIRDRALQFSRDIYKDKMKKLIAQRIEEHFGPAR
jgi:glycosyltransferase involved in cell wall biosynthesis